MRWIRIFGGGAFVISAALAVAQEVPPRQGRNVPRDPLFPLLDANGDGELSAEEIEDAANVLASLDKNEDGSIDRDELAAAVRRGQRGRPGEVITPAAKGERIDEKLQLGDAAPDFTLPLVTGKGEVTLSSFHEKRPVVLIFASYT